MASKFGVSANPKKAKASTSLLDAVLQKSAGSQEDLIYLLKDVRDELEEIRK